MVLRRTRMPAVLVEAGFIDSQEDNEKFDQNFEQIAQAIADGFLKTIGAASETQGTPSPRSARLSRWALTACAALPMK